MEIKMVTGELSDHSIVIRQKRAEAAARLAVDKKYKKPSEYGGTGCWLCKCGKVISANKELCFTCSKEWK